METLLEVAGDGERVTLSGPSPRPPRVVTAVALVIAVVGLVAVASNRTPMWTLVRSGRADRMALLADILVLCVLGLIVAGAIVLVVHRMVVLRRPAAPPLRTTVLRALPIAAAGLAVSGLLLIGATDLGTPAATDGPTHSRESADRRGIPLRIVSWWGGSRVRAGEGEAEQEESGPGSESDESFPLLLVLMASSAVVLWGIVAWRRSGSQAKAEPVPDEASEDARQAMRGAVAGTIDAMLSDPDPGTAIRGAYARLLEGLEACGTGRREHEGPMEHLRRVLGTLHVRPDPLRRLIALFEVARFSTHPLTSAHREQALGALSDVASDLAGAFPSRSGAPGSPATGARP